MYLLIAVVAVCALVSSTFSVFAGRHCLHQRRMPSFLISFAATLLTVLLMVLAIFRDDLLHWRHWIDAGSKGVPLWIAVPLSSVFMLPFTWIPSVIVVLVYRSRFNHEATMPNHALQRTASPPSVRASREFVSARCAPPAPPRPSLGLGRWTHAPGVD